MSRAALYLLGIASLAIVLVFVVFPQSTHMNVDDVHKKHHGDNQQDPPPGERTIDKQELHLDENNNVNGEDDTQLKHSDDSDGKKNDDIHHSRKASSKQKRARGVNNDDQVINEHHDEDHHQDQQQSSSSTSFHRTSFFHQDLANKISQPLLPKKILQLYAGSVMPRSLGVLPKKQEEESGDANNKNDPISKYQKKCPEWQEKDSSSNTQFAIVFSNILREKFPPEKGGALDGSGLHWFLDEGGLIGTSRAGALRNADDDFDFFLLLPHLTAPCQPDSLTCTPEEFNAYIHKFLMVFHNEGMCINKFSTDPKKFKSKSRLMYSFQLNRGKASPENCFQEKKPFAHMHLGIFNEKGEVCTNVWIPPHSTHIKDKLHLDDMLPVSRCRAGPVDVPCPQNITGFLTVRNGGEYRKRSSDGSCLIVKKKWGALRKKNAAKTLKALDECGYNSIVDLLPEFEASGYQTC